MRKMHNSKIVSLVVVMSLVLCFALTGCGDKADNGREVKQHTKKTETENNETKNETDASPITEETEPDKTEQAEQPQPDTNAGDKYKDYVPVLGDETLTKLEEAMTVFVLDEDPGPSKINETDIGWVLDNLLAIGFYYSDPRPYAGLIMIQGQDASPVDVEFVGISKGDNVPYYGLRTSDFEKALSGFYGEDIKVPQGDLHYYTCINDGEKTVEWTDSFRVSYEGSSWERKITDAQNVDGDLVLTVEHTDEYYEETMKSHERVTFEPNPDSMYGYSLKEFKVLDSETNYEDNSVEEIDMSKDEITEEENRIRNAVNSGAAVKVELKAGTDNFDYARWYCFEDKQLVFAYYFNSISGEVDHRFYFKDGRMIEWIEGNGNNDNDRARHYVYDASYEPRWYPVENELLEGSAAYVK